MQIWQCGRIELKPGIGPAGRCRVVVIDRDNQTVVQDRRYHDTMANPPSLLHGQVAVTWCEDGAVRILGSAAKERWMWSQPRVAWEQGGCPPAKILDAILTAVE